MPIRHGAQQITAIKIGSVPLQSIRIGSTLVWSATQLYDGFDVDGPLDPTKWTEIASTPGTFKLGVEAGAARLEVPDQAGEWSFAIQRSRYRMNIAHAADDGYVETRILYPGWREHRTQLGRRGSTDGASGMFMQFDAGLIRLVRRVASVDTVVKECGYLFSGDIIRLTELGDLHTVTRNGQLAGEWDDTTATAAKGASNRSVVFFAESDKDLLSPRRFSPSLDYVEAM